MTETDPSFFEGGTACASVPGLSMLLRELRRPPPPVLEVSEPRKEMEKKTPRSVRSTIRRRVLLPALRSMRSRRRKGGGIRKHRELRARQRITIGYRGSPTKKYGGSKNIELRKW